MAITPDFEAANKASWQQHSHEFLIALNRLIDVTEQLSDNTARLSDNTAAIADTLDGIGTEIFKARGQWDQYQHDMRHK